MKNRKYFEEKYEMIRAQILLKAPFVEQQHDAVIEILEEIWDDAINDLLRLGGEN